MTLENPITLHINTSDFNSINKRLLLQPMTIKACSTPQGGTVQVADEEGVAAVVTHLAASLQEHLLTEAIKQTFANKGAYPEWAPARLIPRLNVTDIDAPWTRALADDISRYVREAIASNQPFKFDAYSRFGSQAVQQQMKLYAGELEELTFYGIVERTISAIIKDSPAHDVPSAESVKLVQTASGISYQADGYELFHTSDFIEEVANVYAEEVYFPDSNRLKEAQFFTYTLMVMSRWAIKRWEVPSSVFERLDMYRERLDIPVLIEEIIEPASAV